MNKNVVEFLEMRITEQAIFVEDAYRFKPKGRFIWLQKMAWRMLHKFGSLQYHYDTQRNLTKHQIRAPTVIETIYKQRQFIFDYIHRDGQHLLIGSKDFAELMGTREIQQYITFPVDVHSKYKILNLNIEIIPWMSGMVVMP